MRHHVTLVVNAGGPQEVSLGEISQEDWDALQVAADEGTDVAVTTRRVVQGEPVRTAIGAPVYPYQYEERVIEGNIWLRGSAIVAIVSTDGSED